MKRPQGFERPTGPAAPRPSTRPPSPGPSTPPRKPVHEATTEPIPIQSAGAAPRTAAPRDTAPIAPVSPLRRPPASGPAAAAPVSFDSSDPSLTPAAARKQLRDAKRARKRYEREEVRRFTWRSRRRRTSWLVALGAVAVLVGFVLVGTYSPLMALRTIEVVGTNRVPAAEVEAALTGQLGTPLPLVDFDQVKSDLSQFTLIRSYVTESRPPDTLVVRIVERQPVGVVPSKGGFDLVDAAGVVIQSDAERPEGYPAITTRNGVGSPGFAAAAAVITALPEAIRSQVETVSAATTDDVTLTLAGGARVVWGSAEESEYKAVVLAALMVGHPVDSVKEFDVSSPDSAVLR